MAKFSQTSLKKLNTCNQDLITLAKSIIEIHDCTVVTGTRNETLQNHLYDIGKSQLRFPKSKHNKYPSEAIDLVPYLANTTKLTYDKKYTLYFAGIVLGVAKMLYENGKMKYKIRWGGNWSNILDDDYRNTSFYDGTHFELIIPR